MKAFTAIRWIGLAGLVLFGAQQIRSLENSSQPLQLLYRLPLAQIELPAEWFSLRDLQLTGDPYWNPDGDYVLPTEKVAEDLLVAQLGDLGAVFADLPAAGADEPLQLPEGPALVIRWEHGSGMIELLHASWLFGADDAADATLMGKEAVHAVDPVTGARPLRSERPPTVQRWVPAWNGSADPMDDPIQDGPGYLEVYGDGGMLLAASGSLESGPSDQQGWLNVAIDLYGDLYFWFDQE